MTGGATGGMTLNSMGEPPTVVRELSGSNGIPHADTYRRVFERVNPEALQQCFLAWVNQVVEATGAQVIPIDGKSVKGSYDRSKKAVSLTSGECLGKFASTLAWASEVEKNNEITAIPALPQLDITGCIITIDAIGTQTEIAGQIVAKGRLYLEPESEPPHPLRSGESVV